MNRNKEIMMLTNKLVKALLQCNSESLVESVEDNIIKKDLFTMDDISNADNW